LKLFGTAGIRLKYPDELTPDLAFRIGNAVGRLGISRRAYVVHDTRTTGPLLTFLFASGLMSRGVDVVYGGVAPTPVAAYAASRRKALGVSITASHNPPEYNGFKFFDSMGFEFTRDLEALIESYVESPTLQSWSCVGGFIGIEDLSEEYTRELLDFIGEPKRAWSPNILVDCANGAAFKISPTIIRSLGGKPYTLNCNPDGFFPTRPPEPRRDVLEGLLGVYKSVSPVVIFAHDGDADRVAVLDPVKGFIRQDRLLAFFAKKALEERRGRVVVSIDTGFVIDEVVERYGGSIERYMLGKTHERVKELGVQNVVMAGEPWKLILPRWGPWVDGILQVAILTKTLVETGKPITKILEEEGIPDYPWDRRSYVVEPTSIRDKVYEELASNLETALGEPVNVLQIDGYRYEYDDLSWVLIRKSGTEPKIRLYAEARSMERLNEIVSKVEHLINRIVKNFGGKIVEVTIG
jgi:phosphomannomutase